MIVVVVTFLLHLLPPWIHSIKFMAIFLVLSKKSVQTTAPAFFHKLISLQSCLGLLSPGRQLFEQYYLIDAYLLLACGFRFT